MDDLIEYIIELIEKDETRYSFEYATNETIYVYDKKEGKVFTLSIKETK